MGSDHAGFELKETLKAALIEEHYEILDVGTHGTGPVDYPDYAAAVGTALSESRADRGIIICADAPIFTGDGITLFTDEKNAADLAKMLTGNHTLEGYLEAHLSRLRPGDYFALLAYIVMNEAHERTLQSIRHSVRDARHVATCLQFGPRFLHSTGQAYKGGPNTGVFLQITCDDALDLAVPDQKYTFGVVKTAQARGDFEVLLNRDRRALRAHLGADVAAHLGTLEAAFVSALQSCATSSLERASLGRG
jgi:transaldolase/glucose-6-phosphate isomerase